MQNQDTPAFSPEVPSDVEHATVIRGEAFNWLDAHYSGALSFTPGDVLRMAGEHERRWLISRLRKHGIGEPKMFSTPATADALTILFLRSKGVKFRDAVDAVVGPEQKSVPSVPRYDGVWNRLIDIALKRLRRRLTARLLGSAVFSLLRREEDHPNCLVIVRSLGHDESVERHDEGGGVDHDYVYRMILERPAPSCWVLSPFREVLFLDRDQPPTRAEVVARRFFRLRVRTEREVYELLLGTMSQASVAPDSATLLFVGRILDIVYLDIEEFLRRQSSQRFEAAGVPERSSSDDLQLWLITQMLSTIYPGSLSEIREASHSSQVSKVLASSAAKPWETSPWDSPNSLEMFSGYTSRTGVPFVVDKVRHPWTTVIESVESEMRYLRSQASDGSEPSDFSAMALPIISSSGDPVGSLYMLMPRLDAARLDVEVRTLTVFSRIVGEIIERQRAAIHTADVSSSIVTSNVLDQQQFRAALLDLLSHTAAEIGQSAHLQRDVRLPFLLLSAHSPDADEFDPAISEPLRNWLVDTLRHLEWRSFVRSHWPSAPEDFGAASFIGELPRVGVMIALGKLVSKGELDRIRNVFPTTINRIAPANSPVRLVAWVLDVPAQRIMDAAKDRALEGLADDVERWAFDVASVVDDVAQSTFLVEEGDWDAALRRVRKALQKDGARNNSYLRRLAADCSFSLGDWPSALKYAHEAAALNRQELGSALVRPLLQEADARLCLCDPVGAWDLYSEARSRAPTHPLPRYYRGQGLLLLARLLRVFQDERRQETPADAVEVGQIDVVVNTLVNGAMDDLTSAADLLDRWGLIPETYQYRNFHLVPTLLGQGIGYLLGRSPGPAASRLQSARRSFPKDDLFLREFIFAKCWEQGLHQRYGALALSDEWASLRDRLYETFGEPPDTNRS